MTSWKKAKKMFDYSQLFLSLPCCYKLRVYINVFFFSSFFYKFWLDAKLVLFLIFINNEIYEERVQYYNIRHSNTGPLFHHQLESILEWDLNESDNWIYNGKICIKISIEAFEYKKMAKNKIKSSNWYFEILHSKYYYIHRKYESRFFTLLYRF